ncbi:MAG TPA: type II secretion system protein [Planctomycetota bacterium]|nr:type II secretion system protein [Planctomycetota bacterium]
MLLVHRGPDTPSRRARRRARRAGFTLVELMVVLVILSLAVGMLSGTMASTTRLAPVQREEALASEAARFQLETLRLVAVADLYALYNAAPGDDPGGAGTAPGSHFDVAGLTAQPGDPDGRVGRLRFPGDGVELREDGEDVFLGLPRDLDGDGAVDDGDHADDYRILPVEVLLEWQGVRGPRTLRFHCQFSSP